MDLGTRGYIEDFGSFGSFESFESFECGLMEFLSVPGGLGKSIGDCVIFVSSWYLCLSSSFGCEIATGAHIADILRSTE